MVHLRSCGMAWRAHVAVPAEAPGCLSARVLGSSTDADFTGWQLGNACIISAQDLGRAAEAAGWPARPAWLSTRC